MKLLAALTLASLAALGACALPAVSDEAAPTGLAEADAAPKPGRFAALAAEELEGRALRSGWKVLGTRVATEAGRTSLDLELDDGRSFAYVALIDLGADADGRSHAARMGERAGVSVHVEGAGAPRADALLGRVLSEVEVDRLDRESLARAVAATGWSGGEVSTFERDGVGVVYLTASRGDASVQVELVQLGRAIEDGRVAVDGDRYLNVFVCRDCSGRERGTIHEAWQRGKARRLLAELTGGV